MPDKIEEFRDEYYFLSNFSDHGFEYEGIYYPTNEHFFQAMKTLDNKKRKNIASAVTPSKAKKLGRRVNLRKGWNKKRHKVMKRGLYEKFAQNPALIDRLLATGEAKLVEGNTWGDNYWGNDFRTKKEGKNYLGKYLMQLRKNFREEK